MKLFLRCIALLFVVVVFATRSTAQQCFTLSSNLAAYVDESTDGNYIYTSVEIDGSEQMTINPTCAPYLPQFYHTPMVYNYLSVPGGASVGGWASGSATCPNCYLSYTSLQSIAVNQGVDVNFSWQVQAFCSGGGAFWGTQGTTTVAITFTTGRNIGFVPMGEAGPLCQYAPACNLGSTPTCGKFGWNIQFANGETCWAHAGTPFVAIKENGVVAACWASPLALLAFGNRTMPMSTPVRATRALITSALDFSDCPFS